ncbi:MAG: hypothetical protein U1C49_00015, partial [Candidatus Andersenbacteria bacterium]|nr:hypothetical protein [Candidatus Andersenbacteria bacterium]
MRWSLGFLFLLLFFLVAHPAEAALLDRVNEAYQVVHGHDPSASEWTYWAGRVQNKEKTTFEALVGAMAWQNINSRNTPVSAPASLPAAGSFKTADSLYPSPYGPNLLSDGTLIRSTAGATVYYVRGGKRSYVLPGVLDKWL